MTIVNKTEPETIEIYRVIKHGFNNPSKSYCRETKTEVKKATVDAISFRIKISSIEIDWDKLNNNRNLPVRFLRLHSSQVR
jgi:hypothetical protein